MIKNFILKKSAVCLAIIIAFNISLVFVHANESDNIYEQTENQINDFVTTGGAVSIEDTTEITTETEESESSSENSKNNNGVTVDIKNENNISISGNTGIITLIIQNINSVKTDSNNEENVNICINNSNNINVTGSSGIINLIIQNIDEIAVNEGITAEIETITETTTEMTTETISKERPVKKSGGSPKKKSSEKMSRKIKDDNSKKNTSKETKDGNSKKNTLKNDEQKAYLKIGSNKILINDTEYIFDASPYISCGYTMVPLRATSQIFNASVNWDPLKKIASITMGKVTTSFSSNSDIIEINGKKSKIIKTPEIKNGRIYLPMRELSEALNATDIEWVPETKEIIITK